MVWGGKRLTGSYWYLSMTGRHQTNVAGSRLKQILFETLQPGLAEPSPPHLHMQESCPWADLCQGITNDWERIHPAHVLSPRAAQSESCYRCLSQHPPRLPQLITGLCHPLALLPLWAELSFSLRGAGCKAVIKSEQKNRFFETLSALSLLVIPPSPHLSSARPILHSHHVPHLPCMHFLSPFPNNCTLSFYCRCWPRVVEWLFCPCTSKPPHHMHFCISFQ